ncbi:MAG: ParB/RepB/Spo0J family partition protein [Xanthomonadales bacterium]|nr:ParB/RepB/Spo0J family partition protein [Xanthomonadales bacterium]
MTKKTTKKPHKRKLGRGLDKLLGGVDISADAGADVYREIPLDLLQAGRYQPRSVMDPERLQELADSIIAQGVVQPIAVRAIGGGRYEIIAGERRWRACQLARLDTVPAVIRDVSDQATVAMALIENIQREDLNPLEEAVALRRLLDEFGLTHLQAAEAVGRSRAAVSNLLRLLELGDEVKKLVDERKLDMGHARALLALPLEKQLPAARDVVARELTVRQTEQLVKRLLTGAPSTPPKRRVSPDIQRLQDKLTEQLGARVQIQHQPNGRGKLIIQYNSADELEGILDHIN